MYPRPIAFALLLSSLAWLAIGGSCAQAPSSARGEKAAPADSLRPEPGWKELGQNLWFDKEGKRAIFKARVVLREGQLEHLVCLKGTKEHEAIVATDAPAQRIHAALLLTGAESGHPVRFAPTFEPPAGTPIAITMRWREQGKAREADARDWVWDEKSKAPLRIDWVFGGSLLEKDRLTGKIRYGADEGDLIVVSNFANAMLDLPMASSSDDADRWFTANTRKIPPLGTEVFVVLEPRRAPPATNRSQESRKTAKPDRP